MNARGATPETVRPVAGVPRSRPRSRRRACRGESCRRRKRALRSRAVRSGRRKCARHDHLRGREALLALRKPGRHRVAGRIEERVILIHAGVDDADLDALARRLETCAPERRCADLLGRRVSCGTYSPGEDVAHSGYVAEQRDPRRSGASRRSRSRRADSSSRAALGKRARRARAGRRAARGDPRSVARSLRERGRGEQHDDLRAFARLAAAADGPPDCEQDRDDERCEWGDTGHRGVRRAEARIGRLRGCGGIGRRARFRSVCP